MAESVGATRSWEVQRLWLDVAAIVLLVVLWLATWIPRLQGPIDLRWDAAVYYTLGTALATGKGYRLLNEPGDIAAVQYPPGLPAIVAVHQRALGTDDPVVVGIALRRFYLVISGCYVAATYYMLRRRFTVFAAFSGAAICVLSMTFVWISDRVYSDVPFLLASTGFMLLAMGETRRAQFGAGTLAILAFLLRTLGAALIVAWIIEAAYARRWRRATVRLLLGLALVGGWQGYLWRVEHSREYLTPSYQYQRAPYLLYNVSYTTNASLVDPFFPERGHLTRRNQLTRFLSNAVTLPASIGEVLTSSATDWSETLAPVRRVPLVGLVSRWRVIGFALVAVGLLTLWGVWLQFRRGEILEPVFVATYILALCVMNFTQELGRYLSGVEPVLIVSLWTAVLGMGPSRENRFTRRTVLAALVVVAIVGEGATLQRAYAEGFPTVVHRTWRGHDVTYRLFSYGDAFRSFDAGIAWVGAHADPRDVVASSQPHWVYLRTGNRAVMPPFERNPERHLALLDDAAVSLVIVDSVGFSSTREYTLPALRSSARWTLLYESSDRFVQVYGRVPPLSGRAGGVAPVR